MLPYIDLIYYDVKFADSDLHRKHTGRSNERILANLRCLLKEEGVEVHPRIPLIPNITATEENFAAIADFLCEAGAASVFLLPYNPLGFTMLKQLGRPMSELPAGFMSPDEEKQICTLFHDIVAKKIAQQDKIAPSMQNNKE
jgi:pyruvate formate lyase activating enzyme